jgi:hypothetical protein
LEDNIKMDLEETWLKDVDFRIGIGGGGLL